MMQSATVLAKTVTYDAARSGLASYSEAGASRGVLLPIGGEFEFYARQRNAGLVPGNRLRLAGLVYDITAIRDYAKVVVCLLRRAL